MASSKTTKVALAKKLGISRSSLYYKPKKPHSDEEDKKKIEAVMEIHRAYSHKRVAIALKMNHKKTNRIMNKFAFWYLATVLDIRTREISVGTLPITTPPL